MGGSGDSQQACSWMLKDHERIWKEISGRSHQSSSLAKRKPCECSEYGYFMHEDASTCTTIEQSLAPRFLRELIFNAMPSILKPDIIRTTHRFEQRWVSLDIFP